jgi:SP family xylose:H+ symportor-like MFS transporter
MYIAEISPARIRGRMVSVNQFAIVSGMLLVYFVNYYIARHGDDVWNTTAGWRWMFGSESLPAALLLILTLIIPESPRWLTKKGRKNEALAILARVDGSEYAREEMVSIEETISHESGSLSQLFLPGMKLVLVIGVSLAVLQQVTGINVLLYFGTNVFKSLSGETIDAALLYQIFVGGTNLLFTIIAIWTVDKLGRKPLMIIGSVGMGICLFGMGMAGVYQAKGLWLLSFVLGYIACFALSVGPVVWVILAEIFPTKIRGRAMGIATICLWAANTVVTQTYPMMAENEFLIRVFRNGFPYFVYGTMCIVLIVFMWHFVPETKGKSLEEIEQMWLGSGK